MNIYRTNKIPILIKNNAWALLNGITSHEKTSIFNAFCNIHGRIIATFEQLQVDEDDYLICIEQPYVEETLASIERFAKLSGVSVEKLTAHVYYDLDNRLSLEPGDHTIIWDDFKMVITPRYLQSTISEEEFKLFRLKKNIPIQGLDYTDEFILNVSVHKFVSFTKGCFLGQEPISKVYNRSKPTWCLEVKKEQDCSDEEKAKMTSKVLDPETQTIKGFVFTKKR